MRTRQQGKQCRDDAATEQRYVASQVGRGVGHGNRSFARAAGRPALPKLGARGRGVQPIRVLPG